MSESLILDPVASGLTPGRGEMVLFAEGESHPLTVDWDGIDWGDQEVEQQLADGRWGSQPLDHRMANRTIRVPLVVASNASEYPGLVRALQDKVALWQSEGGILARSRADGLLYAEVVDASLTLPDSSLAVRGVQPRGASELVLQALPDFFGDEEQLVDGGRVRRINHAVNNIAGWGETDEWEPQGGTPPTLSAVTLGASGAPAANTALDDLGITTAFRMEGAASGARVRSELQGTYMDTGGFVPQYALGLWLFIDSMTADGLRVELTTSGGDSLNGVNTITTVGEWVLVTYDAGENVAVHPYVTLRQVGSGEVDCYFTAVIVEREAEAGEWIQGVEFPTLKVGGSYPARSRARVEGLTDPATFTPSTALHGAQWVARSRHYQPEITARSEYLAWELTPVAPAVVEGAAIAHPGLSDVWSKVVDLEVRGWGQMTHEGTVRVWALVESEGADSVRLRLAHNQPGGAQEVNTPVRLGGTQARWVDLGEVQIQRSPIGEHEWHGAIQMREDDEGGSTCTVYVVRVLDAADGQGVVSVGEVGEQGATLAWDRFGQAGPDLTGEESGSGHTWSTTGSGAEFTVSAGDDFTERDETSFGQRWALLPDVGSDVIVSVTINGPTGGLDRWDGAVTARRQDAPEEYVLAEMTSTGRFTLADHAGLSSSVFLSASISFPRRLTLICVGNVAIAIDESSGETLSIAGIPTDGTDVGFRDSGGVDGDPGPREYSEFDAHEAFGHTLIEVGGVMELRTDVNARVDTNGVGGPVARVRGDRLRLPAGVGDRSVELGVMPSVGDFQTRPATVDDINEVASDLDPIVSLDVFVRRAFPFMPEPEGS